jgi:hypothetical protein
MRCNRVVLGLVLLAVIPLFLSACCDTWHKAGRKLGDAKDEAETWVEKQQDKARRKADEVARDIQEFFTAPTDQDRRAGGACGATPLALSAAALTLVLSRKRATKPGRG